MPLTLDRIEREANSHSKPFLILMYHLTHKKLIDIISEISQPLKEMNSTEKKYYTELLTELILRDLPKKEILRQIPIIAEKVKNKK